MAFAVVRASLDAGLDPRLTAELDTFYTLPSGWGLGVGRLLMRAALDTLRARGYGDAILWTAEENRRPRRTYEAAGWTLDGARRSNAFLGVTLAELRYRIRL